MASTVGDSPLYPLLNEINKAASGGLPFLAVVMTVALPDICMSLISDDGRTTPERYKEWCRNNLGAEFSYATADDLYSMRCGVLHNGRFGDLKHDADVIFAIPDESTNSYANNLVNDAYFYSVVEFYAVTLPMQCSGGLKRTRPTPTFKKTFRGLCNIGTAVYRHTSAASLFWLEAPGELLPKN